MALTIRWTPVLAVIAAHALSACSRGGGAVPVSEAPGPALPTTAPANRRLPGGDDLVALYRRMGLLAEGGETPFVASLSFFATGRPDTTVMMLTVSLANRVLAFKREGDHYRANYQVAFEASQGGRRVVERVLDETVRVLAFRETTRSDESVLFRQFLKIAPGTYDMRLTLRSSAAATGGSAVEATVGVPQLGAGAISSPVPLYTVVPRDRRGIPPQILATPRSTAVFGRDSMVPLYVEGYGSGPTFPVTIRAVSDAGGGVLWSDSIDLPPRGELFSGVIQVPVSQLGVGVVSVGVSRSGSADTVRTPVFVAFGEDLPVATFSEMVDYLRYYASIARLQALRSAAPVARAGAWSQFLRETDPNPGTPEHEGLREYFGRIAQANIQFREEGGAGWMSDRGRVFVSLGRPDQIFEPNVADLSQRGRTQIWDYREHRLQLLFLDQTGFGRWRMTPSSELEFESVLRRVLR